MANSPTYLSFAEQALKYFVREHVAVPDGPVGNEAAWLGRDLTANPDRWRFALSQGRIDELEALCEKVEADGLTIETITADQAKLSGWERDFDQWRTQLKDGLGVVVLAGLPVQAWGRERAELAYWIIGLNLGTPGAQNPRGDQLGHVTDTGAKEDDEFIRLYETASNIGFHCDAADVVGLMCLSKPVEGGLSRIASSVTIYNQLRMRRPDIADRLFEPFKHDLRGEHPKDADPYTMLQAGAFDGEALRTFWHGEYFRSVERHPEAGGLSDADKVFLDLYDGIGAEPDVRLDMELSPGDIQFISNHTIVHSRTAYRDGSGQKRELLRLWLSL